MMAFSREWDRAVDGSPNGLDPMVWRLTRLSIIITDIRMSSMHALMVTSGARIKPNID